MEACFATSCCDRQKASTRCPIGILGEQQIGEQQIGEQRRSFSLSELIEMRAKGGPLDTWVYEKEGDLCFRTTSAMDPCASTIEFPKAEEPTPVLKLSFGFRVPDRTQLVTTK